MQDALTIVVAHASQNRDLCNKLKLNRWLRWQVALNAPLPVFKQIANCEDSTTSRWNPIEMFKMSDPVGIGETRWHFRIGSERSGQMHTISFCGIMRRPLSHPHCNSARYYADVGSIATDFQSKDLTELAERGSVFGESVLDIQKNRQQMHVDFLRVLASIDNDLPPPDRKRKRIV
jgi:hypothetical protein